MMKHIPVMLEEAVSMLNIKDGGIYVDATVGYAGHSSEILKRVKNGYLFAFDQDENAARYSEKHLKEIGDNFKIIPKNFVHLKEELEKLGVHKVDGILFDLGVSSPQIDDAERGFSFMKDAPLDMRMNQKEGKSAADVVNHYDYEELVKIFFAYGEEKQAKKIAKEIVARRSQKEIKTTLELVDVIQNAVGAKYFFQSHPERNIFQSIRIEVNQELKVLESVIPDAISILNPGGRISVITFHSLEDRMVKQLFKKYSEPNEVVKNLPEIPEEYKPLIKLVNHKPILPSEEEIKQNPRSKSAKLRGIERI